jgi:spore maturation protein CgeB
MNPPRLRIVILGLSITSSWGNGHATTYRGLVRELVARGHDLHFLERDVPWYAQHRDLPDPPHGRTSLYGSLDELRDRFADEVCEADLVIVGSFVPQGAEVGDWVLGEATGVAAFYDIDTPVTLAKLRRGEHDYLRPDQVRRYGLYLSFTGGPTLARLEREWGSPMARALYCSVDPTLYFPEPGAGLPDHAMQDHANAALDWDLGYMGTFSDDRQPLLERLMLDPARAWPQGRFVVAGPQYPSWIAWPPNCERIEHLPPAGHRRFYNRQRFTLNLTRADMVEAGWSPSVRLFEAAACGTPIISDCWEGIETLFVPGSEIALVRSTPDVLQWLVHTDESERRAIGERARQRVLAQHTAAHRAEELEQHALAALDRVATPAASAP